MSLKIVILAHGRVVEFVKKRGECLALIAVGCKCKDAEKTLL